MQTTEVYHRIQDESTSESGKDKFQAIPRNDLSNEKLLELTTNTVKFDYIPEPARKLLGIDQPDKPDIIVRISAIPLIEGIVYSSLLTQEMLYASIKNRLADTFSKDGGFRPLQRVKTFFQSITMIAISPLWVATITVYALLLLIKLPVQAFLSYINIIKRLREENNELRQRNTSSLALAMTPAPADTIASSPNKEPTQAALEEQLAALQKGLAAAEARAEAAEARAEDAENSMIVMDMKNVLAENSPDADVKDPSERLSVTEESPLDNLEATIRQLERENRDLRERLSEMEDKQTDYDAQQTIINEQVRHIAELEAALAHNESETELNDSGFEGGTSGDEGERVGELEEQLRLANERASSLSGLLEAERQHNQGLTTTNESLQTEVADLTSALGKVDQSLSGRLKEALAKIKALRAKLDEYQQSEDDIEALLEEKQETIERLKQELSRATGQSPSPGRR